MKLIIQKYLFGLLVLFFLSVLTFGNKIYDKKIVSHKNIHGKIFISNKKNTKNIDSLINNYVKKHVKCRKKLLKKEITEKYIYNLEHIDSINIVYVNVLIDCQEFSDGYEDKTYWCVMQSDDIIRCCVSEFDYDVKLTDYIIKNNTITVYGNTFQDDDKGYLKEKRAIIFKYYLKNTKSNFSNIKCNDSVG